MLELGAGGGLPGLVTAKNGAKSVSERLFSCLTTKPQSSSHQVFLTDYPDDALIKNIEHNVQHNILDSSSNNVHVMVCITVE